MKIIKYIYNVHCPFTLNLSVFFPPFYSNHMNFAKNERKQFYKEMARSEYTKYIEYGSQHHFPLQNS